jgi:ABC-type lipoprotein release transport system permease subunit
VIARFLFGVNAGDPATFAAVCTLLIAVALLATYIPSRRALAVDPIAALRSE